MAEKRRSMLDDVPTTSTSGCIKTDIDVAGENGEEGNYLFYWFNLKWIFFLEILIEDVGTSPCEIGSVIRSYNFETNIDVMVKFLIQ